MPISRPRGKVEAMPDFVTVAKTNDIPPGKVNVYEVNGRSIALCNADGAYYAIDDVCTHDGGPLGEGELQGEQIECPRHGARFDVKTGRAITLPAVQPVKSYPVEVEGDDIRVDLGEAS
jgi:3-phenylpropionate/trans-cinnamate dioxygenase ferredoxin subunit